MPQLQLNLDGKARAKEGGQRSLKATNKLHPGWTEKALQYLDRYLNITKTPFRTEEFREWAFEHGLEQPSHGRAFGPLMLKAGKMEKIKDVGVGRVKNPNANNAFCTLWSKF
jgi:hypothetical protein